MARTVKACLQDIADAINGIMQTLDGQSFQAFEQTWYLQKANERGLEIISEASRSLPDDLKARSAHIPWTQIAGIGNILRHDYQRIEPLIVWNIVDVHLQSLGEVIATELNLVSD